MIWRLTERKDWDSLVQQFSWVRDMDLVPQHALHHAEGSVAVHTRMVLEALQQQPSYLRLAEQDREILWAAALLHDVESVRLRSMKAMGRSPPKIMRSGGRLLYAPSFTGIFLRLSVSASILPLWYAIMVCLSG